MNTVKFEKRNTLVVAHRGLSGIECENTNAAFVAACNRSYFGVETDMHRTADGYFVVFHDSNLVRVAGEQITVEETTLADLQSVILFDKDGSKGREDLRIPTLENYISICKKYGKHCVLELKSNFTDEEVERFIEIIKGLDYLHEVTFISFNYENLTKVRAALPNQPIQFLTCQVTDEMIESVVADRFDVDLQFNALTEENIKALHDRGIKINCWTVDSKEDGERLAAWGVDYITTNIME